MCSESRKETNIWIRHLGTLQRQSREAKSFMNMIKVFRDFIALVNLTCQRQRWVTGTLVKSSNQSTYAIDSLLCEECLWQTTAVNVCNDRGHPAQVPSLHHQLLKSYPSFKVRSKAAPLWGPSWFHLQPHLHNYNCDLFEPLTASFSFYLCDDTKHNLLWRSLFFSPNGSDFPQVVNSLKAASCLSL